MLYLILIFCIALIFPLCFTIIFSFFGAYMGYIGAIELGISSEFFKLVLGLLGFLWAGYIAPSIQKKVFNDVP